ncbi:MAG TPA: hypothetical protein VEB59_14200 [Gemmatimonadales bacterium]|nr:hypothetical protein [Gemmatimonadales bacterium]
MRRSRLSSILMLAALGVGCGSTTTGPDESGARQGQDAPVLRLVLDPAVATIRAGEDLRIHATTASADRAVVQEIAATFSSSDETIATVDGSGIVRGRRPGLAIITVRWNTERAFARIAVLKAEPGPGRNF